MPKVLLKYQTNSIAENSTLFSILAVIALEGHSSWNDFLL